MKAEFHLLDCDDNSRDCGDTHAFRRPLLRDARDQRHERYESDETDDTNACEMCEPVHSYDSADRLSRAELSLRVTCRGTV